MNQKTYNKANSTDAKSRAADYYYMPYKAVDGVANGKTFKSACELLAKVYTGSAQGEILPYSLFVPE